jgi:hypothetical protein
MVNEAYHEDMSPARLDALLAGLGPVERPAR